MAAAVDVTDARAVDGFAAEVTGTDSGASTCGSTTPACSNPSGPWPTPTPGPFTATSTPMCSGCCYGSATFARHVRSRPGRGVLVNVSSGAATRPYEGWAVYCGSKAAVEMITEVVAREERGAGLSAFALAPGLVDTDMQALIRAARPEDFPEVERFRRVHEDDGFNSADWVARFIVERLVGADAGTGTDRADGADRAEPVRLRVPEEPTGR